MLEPGVFGSCDDDPHAIEGVRENLWFTKLDVHHYVRITLKPHMPTLLNPPNTPMSNRTSWGNLENIRVSPCPIRTKHGN